MVDRELSRLIVGVVLVACVAGGVSAQSEKQVVRRVKKEADAALKRGDLEQAAFGYRKLSFAGLSAKARIKSIRKKQVKELLSRARGDGDRDGLLQAAFRIDPSSRSVRAAFKKAGLSLKASSQARADRFGGMRDRRAELGLNASFRVLRRGPIVLYTNVDRAGHAALEQMLNATVAHYQEYARVFEAAGLAPPVEGLDVVLFATRAQYLRGSGAPGASIGLYDPARGCGFFHLRETGFDFPTLLHEMTHQLNHKVLHSVRPAAWFEEGISDYFGSGSLTQGGRRIELGRVDVGRLVEFREISRRDALVPLNTFFAMPRAELTSRYYAQAWALVHYLMSDGPVGRMIAFDLIQAAKQAQRSLVLKDVREILGAYGLTVTDLEQRYLTFFQGNLRRR